MDSTTFSASGDSPAGSRSGASTGSTSAGTDSTAGTSLPTGSTTAATGSTAGTSSPTQSNHKPIFSTHGCCQGNTKQSQQGKNGRAASLFDLVENQAAMGQQEDLILPPNKRLINKLGIGLCFVENADDPQFGTGDKEGVHLALQNALNLYATADANNLNWEIQEFTPAVSIELYEGAKIPGITEAFNKEIDAAVNLGDADGFLLFSGKWVARCSSLLGGFDEGYPKLITEQFPDLQADWKSGVDAAMWSEKANRLLLFRTYEVASYADPDGPIETGYPDDIANWMPTLPNSWMDELDGAFYQPTTGLHYLIKGTETLAIAELDLGPMDNEPVPSAEIWAYDETVEDWNEGITAAMYRKDQLYLFRHDAAGGKHAWLDIGNNLAWQTAYNGLGQFEVEDLWRNPAMAALGYTADWDGHHHFVADVFANTNSDNAFIIYVTNFPTSWYGYAHADKRRLVLRYSDYDGDFVELEELVFHEMGHLFGAIDEYMGRPDLCPKLGGAFFTGRNGNALECTDEAEWIAGPEPIEIQHVFGFDSVFGNNIQAAYGDYISGVKHFYFFSGNRYRVVVNYSDITSGDPLIKDTWLGMPGHFHSDLDAALKIPNGAVYFFKGKEYVAFGNGSFDMLQYGNIADLIPNLPPSFQDGFDAAFHRNTEKVYIFKAHEYLRFSNGIWNGPDPGYPHIIKDKWTGFPDAPIDFTKNFAAALQDHNTDMYFYKHGHVGTVRHGLNCTMHTASTYLCKYTRFHLGWGPFMSKIDAAVYIAHLDQLFVFNEDHYLRYSDMYVGYDENYPAPTSAGFKGVPLEFKVPAEAVLYLDQVNMTLFISGGKCIAWANDETTQIHPLEDIFPNMPPDFYEGLDAAVWMEDDNRIYFFKGDQFVAFKPLVGSSPVLGPLAIGGGHWPGLPSHFQSDVDAVTVDQHSKIYFFKGKEYVRFSKRQDGVDEGPEWINSFWMPFPKEAGF